MRTRRILTLGPSEEALWVRVHVRQIGERCVAMILADDVPPPEPGTLKGLAFFGETLEDVERLALEYLGEGVSQN